MGRIRGRSGAELAKLAMALQGWVGKATLFVRRSNGSVSPPEIDILRDSSEDWSA